MALMLCRVSIAALLLLSAVPALAKPEDGRGGKGGKCKEKSPACADGSHPVCPDGSKPDRDNHPSVCSDGEPLCQDGSTPSPPKRRLQGGRGGKGGKSEDDCEETDVMMIAIVSAVSATLLLCICTGAYCWCRAARVAKADPTGVHKVTQGTNVESSACVVGQPVPVPTDKNMVVPAEGV